MVLQSCHLGMREPEEYSPMDQQVSFTSIRLYLHEGQEVLPIDDSIMRDLRIVNEESPGYLEIRYRISEDIAHQPFLIFNAPYPNINKPHILSRETEGDQERVRYRTSFTLLYKGQRLTYDCHLTLHKLLLKKPIDADPVLRLDKVTCGEREYNPLPVSRHVPLIILSTDVSTTPLRPL